MDHQALFPQILTEAVVQGVGSVYDIPQLLHEDRSLYAIEGMFSTIYLKGHLKGKMSFFIREEGAARIVGRMLGQPEISEDASEAIDGFGELLNIVAGCFKTKLDAHKVRFDISIPSTRLTASIPASNWEHNIEQIFSSADIKFKVILSYRLDLMPEAPAAAVEPAKPKLSAADLIKMAMAKKKA
ncbi:MAG: chemotaxis protein CheX [Candidatus Omnitrophica bacterium]|nr:chemotaxis protein CheX [Candidatus Omnitrophota bacterium]